MIAAAVKKAVGYTVTEITEEYAVQDGAEILVKKKICVKDVPPDINALKWLLGEKEEVTLSREDIERERKELTDKYFELMKKEQCKEEK